MTSINYNYADIKTLMKCTNEHLLYMEKLFNHNIVEQWPRGTELMLLMSLTDQGRILNKRNVYFKMSRVGIG